MMLSSREGIKSNVVQHAIELPVSTTATELVDSQFVWTVSAIPQLT